LIDKWCADFYRSIGCNIKSNVNCASTCELMIFGDVVIQIYLPSQIKNGLKNYFSKIKDVKKLKQKSLIEDIFEKKTDIKVIINKDKEIAEQIKKETLGYF
ncbi:MAG: hypothetical protein KKA79_10045, partial [Nanoarchaeota archaeon]|nr:hypothetical protein [Nanoarchaeota archaeon]